MLLPLSTYPFTYCIAKAFHYSLILATARYRLKPTVIFDKVFTFRYFSLKKLFKQRLINDLNMSLVVEAALGIVIITAGIAFFKMDETWRHANKQLDEIAKRLDSEKESFIELKRDLNDVLREFVKKADVKQADAIINKAASALAKEKMVVTTQNG